MKAGIERIAFEQTLLRFKAQHTDLANLRNQASISAAVTGLIGTVFASLLGVDGAQKAMVGDFYLGFSVVGMILVVLLSASLLCSALVLVQFEEFTFAFDPKKMMAEAKKQVIEENFFAKYVKDGDWFFKDNETKIEKAQDRLWWAMVLGWSQIFPWMILIVGSADG